MGIDVHDTNCHFDQANSECDRVIGLDVLAKIQTCSEQRYILPNERSRNMKGYLAAIEAAFANKSFC